MKTWVLICWTLAAITIPVAPCRAQTTKYPYPGGVVLVSFDPGIISKPDLDKLMRLSPNLVQYNDLFVPIDVRRCLPRDPAYTDCGSKTLKVSNVEENIRRIAAIRDSLIKQKVPDDLRPVQEYLTEIQNFALWQTGRVKDFLVTQDAAVLEAPYNGLDLAQRCNAVLQKIKQAPGKDRETLVVIDWHNCVWPVEMEKIGSYPKHQWESFLTSHKIREAIKEEAPD
jgi:hypothetical protein